MLSRLVTAAAVLAALGACTTNQPPAAPAPELPKFTTTTAAPAASTAPTGVRTTCLTIQQVGELLRAAVTGATQTVVGIPEPKIGRTARLDCYYGMPDGQPLTAASVSVGVAAYTDAAAASRRVTNTVSAETAAGAAASDVPVGANTGVLLRGEKLTLVASDNAKTVVVIAVPTLLDPGQAPSLLAALAAKALGL